MFAALRRDTREGLRSDRRARALRDHAQELEPRRLAERTERSEHRLGGTGAARLDDVE
jgi:hypothetical protein